MRALKTVLRTISHILSVVLCLLLLVATVATMLVADLRVATNKDNLKNVLSNILSAPPQVTFGPISAATTVGPDMKLDFEFDLESILNGDGGLTEVVVEQALEMLKESEVEIEKEAIEQFVEESTIKDFISDKTSSVIVDVVTGENTTTITGEEIKELLTENKELLEEHFEIVITEEEIEEVVQVVEDHPVIQEIQQNGVAGLLSGGTTAPDSGNTDDPDSTPDTNPGTNPGITPSIKPNTNPFGEINKIMDTIRTMSSDTVFFSCIGACALLVALLFLLAWNKPYIAMFYSGSTLFTTGLIFLVPTLIAQYAPAVWMGLFSNIPEVGPVIGGLSRFVLMLTSSVCTTITVVGLVLFIGGIVLLAVMKKIKKSKAAKAANVVTAAVAVEAPVSPSVPAAAEVVETAAPAEPTETAEAVETAEATEAVETVEAAEPVASTEAVEAAESAEVTNA